MVSLFPCFCITIMHCNLVFAFGFPWRCLLSGSCSMFRGQAGLFNSAAASHEYTRETVSAAGLISGGWWVGGGGSSTRLHFFRSPISLSSSLARTWTHTAVPKVSLWAGTQHFIKSRSPVSQLVLHCDVPIPFYVNASYQPSMCQHKLPGSNSDYHITPT